MPKIGSLYEVTLRETVGSRRVGACVLVTTYANATMNSYISLPSPRCLFEPAALGSDPGGRKNPHGQSLWAMRGAYSARPNRLAPCYLLAAGVSDSHGRTATRHLGQLTTRALLAEDTDHLILAWWQRTKQGSGLTDESLFGKPNMMPYGSEMGFLWERPNPTPGIKKTRPK